MFQFKNQNLGFTFLEVIIAIFVIIIGILGAFTITQQITFYSYRASSRLTAVYLAKEGIEIVRNIRDTNWIQEETWDAGLNNGEWEADYTTTILEQPYEDGNFLKFSSNFYNYDELGSPTNFKRKIEIDGSDSIEVTVKVTWEEKGRTYGPITVKENLYNWYYED